MQKAYSRTNWENYPSDKTPINEANLNKLEAATDEIDNRVVELDNTKFDKTEASKLIKNFDLDKTTGVITVTYLSGAKITIDTMLEKLAVNFGYDAEEQKLVIILDDGTVQYVDLKALITEYEFKDTDTVAFIADIEGKVSAIVKEGSIEEKHLRPDYLSDIKVESSKAEASARAAATSEINAKLSENNARTNVDKATQFVDEAMQKLDAGELKGDKGERGNLIHQGNLVKYVAGSNPFGITSSLTENILVGDYYINSNSGDYFICTAVDDSASTWDYINSLKGADGERGSMIYSANIGSSIMWPPVDWPDKAVVGDIVLDKDTGDLHKVTQTDPELLSDVIGNIMGPQGEKGDTDTETQNNLTSHTSNKNNPHGVTASQIGAVTETIVTTITDFNTFTNTGIYHIKFSGADNQPCSHHGTLIVDFSVGTPYQIYTPDNVATCDYKRHCSSGTWSSWTERKYTDNNTDTKVTNTLNTTAKAYVTGTTSASTNTGTQVFDTGVYLGTGTGQLNLIGSSSTNYSIGGSVLDIEIPSYTNSLSGISISPYNADNSDYVYGLSINCGNSTGPGMRAIYVNSPNTNQSTVYINRSGTNAYALQVPNGKSYIATIYSNSSAITTSDREKKTDIQDIASEYEDLFFKLCPRLFRFKEGTSGRIHIGAIAQEVEDALNEVGISDTEFAGFVRQEKDYIVDEETGEITQEEGYDYYLRYEEFIMLNSHMIQKLYAEKEEQDKKIIELENRIKALEYKM